MATTRQIRTVYRLNYSETTGGFADSLNLILAQISDRLDKIEGLRGTPQFLSPVDMAGNTIENVPQGTSAGQVLTADFTTQSALAVSPSGLEVSLAQLSGLEKDTDGLGVLLTEPGGLQKSISGLGVLANSLGAIEIDVDGLSVYAKDLGGVIIDGDGLSVDVPTITPTIDHGLLLASSLLDDDHTQYLNSTRFDALAATTVTAETSFGVASNAGAASTYSKGDHTHGTPTAPTIPVAASTVSAETSFGIASNAGSAATFSKGDHTHGTPTAPTIPAAADTVVTETTFSQTSLAGSNATFSRSDHTHGTPSGYPLHGVEAYGALSISGSTVTMASGTNTYWYQGVKYTTTSAITCDLDSDTVKDSGSGTKLQTNQIYYVYFKDSSGTLYWSTLLWSLKTKVPVCTVYWNGSAGALCKEAHNHTRDLDWHINAHLTIGARYYSGLDLTKPTTSLDSSLDIVAGTIYDEDLVFSIGNIVNLSRIWYLTSGKYTWVDSALPYAGASGDPKYANATTLVSVDNNKYVCQWVYASGDVDYPIYIFPGTAQYTTIALARSEVVPAHSGYGLNPELKLLYRFIYRGDGEFQESSDYRTASSLPSGFVASTTASAVSFAPAGNIASTNVQSALEEIDSEKLTLAGIAGGQTAYGGTAASEGLVLNSTAHGTKGSITLGGTLTVNEVSGNVGIGVSGPAYPLDVKAASAVAARLYGNAGATSDNVQLRFAGQKDGELWAIGCDVAAGGSTGRFEFYNLGAAGGIAGTKLTIQGDGNIGIGIAAPTSALHVEKSYTDPANPTYGSLIKFSTEYTGAETVAESLYNSFLATNTLVNSSHINSGIIVGCGIDNLRNNVGASSNDSGTLSLLAGLSIQYGHNRTNTSATPTTTTVYGQYMRGFGRIGTVTTMYDIYIDAPLIGAGGSITNHWGIYQNDTANNYFGGNVGIGTNAPTAGIDISADIIRVRTAKTPASAAAAGNVGDICWDASYVYVCTATNTWKRAGIATW